MNTPDDMLTEPGGGRAAKAVVRAGTPLRFAMLFGSVAKGTDGPKSDW